MRGHQHLHEVAGFLVAGFAGDLDFVDFLVVEIAQRALDQRSLLVDEGRGLRLQGHVADGFPHPDQIFEVALDFRLGARGARGAQDDAHALGHVEILHHVLEPRTVLRRGDLAADAAAARGVGHQHGVAAGQREIGGQRRALVAALFLDDLHQHHLAALDDFLDLVLAARTEGALRHLFQDVVAADGFDDFLFGVVVVFFFLIVVVLVALRLNGMLVVRRSGVFFAGLFGARRVLGMSRVFFRVLGVDTLVMAVFFVNLGRSAARRPRDRGAAADGFDAAPAVSARLTVVVLARLRLAMAVIVRVPAHDRARLIRVIMAMLMRMIMMRASAW